MLFTTQAYASGDSLQRLERLDDLLAAGRAEAVVQEARDLLAAGSFEARHGWRLRQRLAVALLMLDDPQAAMIELEAALVDAPEDPALHLSLGRALWRLNRRGRAIAEFEAALELAPDQWSWRLEYAEALLDLGVRRDCLRQIHLARRICDDCLEALKAEANAYLVLGDPAGGLDALRLLYAQEPRMDVRRLLALALWAANDPAGVAALLDTVLISDLTGDEVMLLVQSDRRLGRAERALDWVRSDQPALAVGWESEHDFWAVVSEICLSTGHTREALSAIDRALDLRPEAAIYHHNRAVILLELGQDDEAEGALSEARRLDPGLQTAP